jgi:hypothetical protein
MLTATQAASVARECIKQATGFSGSILASSVLKNVGVVDLDAREAVNEDIVTDTVKGVQRFGYELGAMSLTFTINSKFFELRDEIVQKATPTQQVGGTFMFAANTSAAANKPKKKKKTAKSKEKGGKDNDKS